MRYLILIANLVAGCGSPIEFPDDVPAFGKGAVAVLFHPDFPDEGLTFECGKDAVDLYPDDSLQVQIKECGEPQGGFAPNPFALDDSTQTITGSGVAENLKTGWMRREHQNGRNGSLWAWDVR